ncbi:MAG: hypothetical protein AAF485_18665, partial [Chloroflexota bacterium]
TDIQEIWPLISLREWQLLFQSSDPLFNWQLSLERLFNQQVDQITVTGTILGLIGLAAARRYWLLFGPPFLAFILFGLLYQTNDVDGLLLPATLTLCIGLGYIIGFFTRRLASWLVKLIRVQDEAFRGSWLSTAIRWGLFISLLGGAYLFLRPIGEKNYEKVDLSEDWQAEDLVEELIAIAQAGTPISMIGEDHTVLPIALYAKFALEYPVEPLSANNLSRMPENISISLLQNRFEAGQRVLIDNQTLDDSRIPWLNTAINRGQIFKAPTGHPYLWELLRRPTHNVLPDSEAWEQLPPGQFIDGDASIIAYHQQLVNKRTGCFLRLTLFWRAEQMIDGDYNISVQPLGGDIALAKNDHFALMRGYLPTSQIRLGEIVRDEIDLLILQPTALAGVRLLINVYQIQGDQFPTFGEVTLPIMINPDGCQR